ncbi:insulinase family protein [bacterium]|nr:MAG: insulinase family protein [bacterium]
MRRLRCSPMKTLALAALTLTGTTLISASARAQKLPIEEYKLPNGMKVILHVDHSLPVATINTWFRVGSKDEPDGRSGFAHLYEHLMFMGTERVPNGQFDQLMERAGGQNNASTAQDRTNYYSSGPSNILPLLLYLDADRLEDLGRTMTPQKVDLQREVVLNERRQSTENQPYGRAYEALPALLYPKGHPYSWSVIGSPVDLRAARNADVKEFFSTFYTPQNATLVVAGDFDPKTVKPLVAKWFGTLPSGKPAPRRPVPAIPKMGVKRAEFKDQVEQAKTIMVWHSPAKYKRGDYEMRLLGPLLSDGLGSRLYDRLVVQDKIATDVSAYQDSNLLDSTFTIEADAAEVGDVPKVEAAIAEEIARFVKEGPKPDDLKRVEAKQEARLLGSIQSIDNRADLLNELEFYNGKADSFDAVLKAYRAVTPASIRAEAARVLDLNNRLIVTVVPGQPEPTATAPAPAGEAPVTPTPRADPAQNPRATIPTPGPAAPFTAPAPKEFTLSNGVRVSYWNRPALPLMAVEILFPRGANTDPRGQEGRASLAAEMLTEGAGDLSATEFKRRLDLVGADFGASAGTLTTTASLSVPSRGFPEALGLVAIALASPRYGAEDYARVKRLTLASIDRRSDNPNTIARLVANRELFGAASVYGRAVDGDRTTVEGIDLAKAEVTHNVLFNLVGARIFVAGSLSESEVKAALERELGSILGQKDGKDVLPTPVAPAAKGQRVVIVDRPGAVQTVINVVAPGVRYSDPSRIGLTAVGTILGGSFTSRLNQNLREANGYTYGASSRFGFQPALGTFGLSTQVRADVTGASLREILKEVAAIRTGDIKPEEATKASTILRQNAKSGIDFDDAVIVLVGDRAKIEAQLAGLGLPTPTIAKL